MNAPPPTLAAALGSSHHSLHWTGEWTGAQRAQDLVARRRWSWDLSPCFLSPRGLLVAFDMGLQGGECSSPFRFCEGTETHFRGTRDCKYKGVSPDTQFCRLRARLGARGGP